MGSTYRFFIRAYNNAGYTDSLRVQVVLSAVPAKPTTVPISDASVTNEERIKILFGPQDASQNGGSPILSYELQMDAGLGDGFVSLIGGQGYENSLETKFVIE